MAIDEKKLIEDIVNTSTFHWFYQSEYEKGKEAMQNEIIGLIKAQPKLDVPDTNVGKMDIEFEELEVRYPPDDVCIYPEYRGKPYFAIKYKENGEHFVGYGTYKPEVLSRYLRDYFMPSAMPQEPKWIPCSERLPEENKEVLIQIWYGTMTVGCLSDNRWISEAWPYQIHEVAAWMPLPEPYKEDE